jgi:putative ABC transport system permease protein
VIRTASDPRGIVTIVRATVRDAAPGAPIESIQLMEDLVSASLARPRLYAVLLGTFAACALAIAAAGLFGVLSYSVAQRAREIGVRTALGARPSDIVRLVVAQSLSMTGVGLAAGLLLAVWTADGLSTFLYGVTTGDAATFAAIAVTLLVVAAIASYVPARRAARVDPVRVLRS